jgi:hypothetical protein
MKRSQRISRRVIGKFLQSAAFALACGAVAAAEPSYSPPAKSRSASSRSKTAPQRSAEAQRYRHEFTLAEADAEYPARVKVTTVDGKSVLHGIVHAPGRLGPLANGAYAVAIRTPSGDEVQLIRIGPDTDPYLSFLSPPEEA